MRKCKLGSRKQRRFVSIKDIFIAIYYVFLNYSPLNISNWIVDWGAMKSTVVNTSMLTVLKFWVEKHEHPGRTPIMFVSTFKTDVTHTVNQLSGWAAEWLHRFALKQLELSLRLLGMIWKSRKENILRQRSTALRVVFVPLVKCILMTVESRALASYLKKEAAKILKLFYGSHNTNYWSYEVTIQWCIVRESEKKKRSWTAYYIFVMYKERSWSIFYD